MHDEHPSVLACVERKDTRGFQRTGEKSLHVPFSESLFLVASLLLVVRPGAPSRVPSEFLRPSKARIGKVQAEDPALSVVSQGLTETFRPSWLKPLEL